MKLRATFVAALCALTLALENSATQAAVGESDSSKAGQEAGQILSEYLKIDTTNPPGNEKRGAEYLKSVLEKNGIEAQIFDVTPTRACVYARLKGTGKKKAVVLLNHIDVVPAQAKDWTHPPFGGEVHNGELWGRGAYDMKGMGIIELEAMLMIKRSGQKLDRDIIFLGTPDEEGGADYGAKWFKEHHGDLVKDAEFLLNEGFHIDTTSDGKNTYWGVNVAEKNVLWLKLTTKGHAGHASMPISNSANNRLVRALNKIVNRPFHPVVIPAVNEYFKQLSENESGAMKAAYQDIGANLKKANVMDEIMKDPIRSSMLINTISLTVLKSGYKTNVIPGEATAELDCRLLPTVDHEKFIAEVKGLIDDPAVEVSVLEWEKAAASPYDTDLFKTIKAVADEEGKESGRHFPVVPVVVPWFTDSHWFRELGIISYGFEPVEVDPEHMGTMHGVDERIPLATLSRGVNRMYKLLVKLGQ